MLEPENHFGALWCIKMAVPGVFPINIQALQIMQIHANGLMKSWPPHSARFKEVPIVMKEIHRIKLGEALKNMENLQLFTSL